ncbi:CDP-glycerol glycerophosphotransferase family protein [Microbacterium sp. cf332]|uniref:CDP-glycerol glycerophosphotransferase family protein n=1 Tax=Microbacterium sp. cf332 TaxID=1761804 RepID=UPI00088C76E2|nr:CDP-glycerol glycerophosphotransferase family protein [Microbacterium sp. cf332]SDQ14502.1 CDP-glycerol glycerophosphotransferase, TagB/SpsB family [Microbacterium sp. cf332]
MASFSFGAGNVRKVLRIPAYLAGRVATLVIPRRRGDWVFGCAAGITDGALALWQAGPRRRAVWLVSSDEQAADAERRGIPTVRRDSLRGFWRTARAGVVVVTHGFGDVNRYGVGGAFLVQLWHGIPLKRIGLDAPVTTDPGRLVRVPGIRRLLAWAYRRTQGQIDLLPAASHLVRGRLESAFGLEDDRVPVLGEPRVDVLSSGDPAAARRRARASLDELVPGLGGSRLVLYAPTWRDGEPDPATPGPADWDRVLGVLEAHDAVLLIRSHPLGGGDYTPPRPTSRVRMLGSAAVADVTPLLAGVDALVTDYSSLAYDAGLVPLPTLFLAPDVESYARTRGFYGTYREVAGDDVARSWEVLCALLDELLGHEETAERLRARAAALSRRVHAWRDGGNARRVHEAIVAAVPAAGERA